MLEHTRPDISPIRARPAGIPGSDWLWANRIRIAGMLMVGAQVWWMGAFLSRSFFRLDDFYYLERGLSNGLTWNYLMWSNSGQLTPLGFAISWVLVRISPMDWTLTSAVTLVMLAGAGLALLRLLRTLFGDHPGILLLMFAYLISPLGFAGLSWWSVALELVPLEIAMFCALTSHIHYVRTGKFRYAVVTALWLLVGMASSVKGVGVPFLLLAITSGWLIEGSWAVGLLRTLRRHWGAWLMYAVILGGYVVAYMAQLHASGQKAIRPGAFSGVVSYSREIITSTFVPGVLGGPWNWLATGNQTGALALHGASAVASPPADLVRVAWVVAAAIVLLSIWNQPRAWRAWIIVLAWLIVIDTIPALGRLSYLSARLLGHETRYVMEAVGVLVVCAGLSFLPLAGQEATRRRRIGRGRPTAAVVMGLATAVLIGSLVSYHNYLAGTSNEVPRSFFATARAALAQAPPGTQIVNATVPPYVTDGAGSALGNEVKLLGPMRSTPGVPMFVSRPAGTIDQLLMFNGLGQLVHVQVIGAGAQAPVCFPASKDGVTTVRLGALPAGDAVSELRVGYLSGSSGRVAVTYAGQTQTVEVRRGLHSAFLPVSGRDLTVKISGMGRGFCVGDVQAGQLWPGTTDAGAVPAEPIGG
jgi:hypothetical protein